MREPRAILDLADASQFQEDLRALRVTDSTCPHQGITVQFTFAVRGGQANQPLSSTGTRRLNGVKSVFLRRLVSDKESLMAPNPKRNPDRSFKTLAFILRSHVKLESVMDHNR